MMNKKIQIGIICSLLSGKDFIFENTHTIKEIYSLSPQMFNVPNHDFEKNKLESL